MPAASPPLDLLSMGRTLVDLYPEQDGPLDAVTTYASSVGGSPTNVAIAAARLGRRTGVVSRVGDDPLGRYARAALAAEDIDVSQVVPVAGASTPVAVCEIQDPFPLTIYRPAPPVDLAIRPESLDRDALVSARILWTSLSGHAGEPSRAAHQRAAELRGRHDLILDLDYRPAFWNSEADAGAAARDALASATIAVGNIDECRIAVGATEPEDAATKLLATGVRLAIVKLGSEGVLAATPHERVAVRPIAIRQVNGLGAGDAFGGALCHGLLAGWALGELLAFANAAGAVVASRRGCSAAMPTAAEVGELLATSRRG
jgi:5-dehydro-2-deoxygluconokinase